MRLKWQEFYRNKFKAKSTSNPRNKDAPIEIYLTSLEEKLMNMEIPLTRGINKVIEKLRKRGDLIADTIKYFMVKDPKFARFNLLPKIHKWLHDVSGRPVISNCGYY